MTEPRPPMRHTTALATRADDMYGELWHVVLIGATDSARMRPGAYGLRDDGNETYRICDDEDKQVQVANSFADAIKVWGRRRGYAVHQIETFEQHREAQP
jgi:hypothetical protein